MKNFEIMARDINVNLIAKLDHRDNYSIGMFKISTGNKKPGTMDAEVFIKFQQLNFMDTYEGVIIPCLVHFIMMKDLDIVSYKQLENEMRDYFYQAFSDIMFIEYFNEKYLRVIKPEKVFISAFDAAYIKAVESKEILKNLNRKDKETC